MKSMRQKYVAPFKAKLALADFQAKQNRLQEQLLKQVAQVSVNEIQQY
jgi:hypothetical protein